MEQLLARPEIQSALLPFVAALLACLGLRKFTALAWIWSIFIAFLIAALLINGLSFTPLTGTRKIILLVLAGCILATGVASFLPGRNLQRAINAAACLLALAWVFWVVVARMDVSAMLLNLATMGGFGLALLILFDRVSGTPEQLHGAGFSLMLGVGLSITAAASALLGQLTLALAAASGGVFLAWVVAGNSAAQGAAKQPVTTLPYVLAPLLLGSAGVIFARLPWYALIPLALIPLLVGLVSVNSSSRFLRALLTSLPGLVVALAVAFWIWQSGSSDSGY